MPKETATPEERRLRDAALEWREKYRNALVSSDASWNKAIQEAIEVLGTPHIPPHTNGHCLLCWIHEKLRALLRMDVAGYIPLKERLKKAADKLHEGAFDDNFKCSKLNSRRAYQKGIRDMMDVVDQVVDDSI